MDVIQTIVIPTVTFIVGGGLVSYLKFFADKSKEHRSVLEEELSLFRKRYTELRQELDELSVLLIPSAAPEWRKNYKGEYEYVSPSYEVNILLGLGLAKSDIIGKKDAEVFGDYPEFVSLLKAIDNEARLSPRRYAIRFNVQFPGSEEKHMVIKEIAHSIAGKNYFIGRCYPNSIAHEKEQTTIKK
ncbi:hypothetical protein EKK58_05935 [Candidatus Dependentiae bacterium]|nr:MAG: hypothetical protein EKK58_05935 [Candidatus Dependentiae bacterium]